MPALPTAFALSPSALSPGLSPAYVAKCAPIRSTSVDSETSSSTPYAAAKRQCLDALHPSTPTGLCSRWQQQPEPQSTHKMLGNGTLTCSGSYQCMPQQPQRHSSFLDGATEMPPQPLFGQAAPTRASDINCRQQWTELHCSLSQHQLQHHHQQQSLTQQQMQTQTSQHQRDCCNRQTSSAVQQTANSELIHFVQQVFDTHTPPQRQEQLQSCRARQPRHQLPCLAGGRAILSSSAGHMQPAAVLHLQQQQTQSTQSQSRATLPQDHLRYLWQVHQHMQAQRQLALLKQNAAVQQSLLVRQHDVSVHQPTFPRIPSLGFADLMMYWAKGLALQRPESLHLACHLWNRVQSQVHIVTCHSTCHSVSAACVNPVGVTSSMPAFMHRDCSCQFDSNAAHYWVGRI